MGISENLQKYIIAIEKNSEPIEWAYNRKTISQDEPQTFEAVVSFQFIKVVESDITGDSNSQETSWWRFDNDLFYAFDSSKSGAEAL